MKNLLSQVLENIRLGNREEAQKLFNEYVTDKSSFIISELYGDSDFEAEIEKYVMNTERYYYEARELMASGADYSEWEDFVKKVAMENDIMPEGEDDVYDAAQGLMRDREMLGEGLFQEDEVRKAGRNYVAKHMNKVNRSAKHRDKKNDYRRNPKHKKKITDE